MPADARAEALNALSQFLVSQSSLGETLLRVSEITTAAMPTAQMAGIAMLDERGRATTGVFTHESSPAIDAAQYKSGKGPCLDAWRQKRLVRIDDIVVAAKDYPEFSQAAREYGVLSTLSLPLVAADRGIGALNLYARTKSGFSPEDEAVGMDLATAAAVVLANASAYWEALELSEQLTQAMKSRAIIEQAKGMLMAQSPDLSADDAFDVLRRASQRENVKLRDIAQRIVDRKPLAPNNGNVERKATRPKRDSGIVSDSPTE